MDPAGPAVVSCLSDLGQATQLFWNVPMPLPSWQRLRVCRRRKAAAVTYREGLKLLAQRLELAPPAGVSLHRRQNFMSFLLVVKNGISSPAFFSSVTGVDGNGNNELEMLVIGTILMRMTVMMRK